MTGRPDGTDLTDPDARAEVVARLAAELWGGRPVVLGPFVLAGATPYVAWLREHGCPVLVVSTAEGAGELPTDCEVVEVAPPATAMVTEELRAHDRLVRELPVPARAAIDRFDPDRAGAWFGTPFVTSDRPIDGRPVTSGRPAAYLRLEDKMLADAVWDAAEVARAPSARVPVDRTPLDEATERLAGPLGAVWVGDARDGFHGGGNFVRWVADQADRAHARAFFAARCDRVRVMPFLDGVPCSIHGFVLPDGTAALRPVEIVMLRRPADRQFVYAGLGTTWDPPGADREEMRAAVRRVGAVLQREHGYRGAFGIDGVLTADGFRPTELNTRKSAGATTVGSFDRWFFEVLQAALLAGLDTGLTAVDVEALVPLMDAERSGRPVALGEGMSVDPTSYPVAWDGAVLSRSDAETGSLLETGQTPSGMFARVRPCTFLAPGERLAPLNVALLAHLDREHGTSFGAVDAAPDIRSDRSDTWPG